MRSPKCARRSTSAATTPPRRAARSCPQTHAGPDRRDERAALSRARRVRLHQPVEFPAGDLPRPGRRGARRRQCGGRQARRADAADRRRGGAAAARGRRAGERAASRAGRRRGRRGAGRPIRASPASPSPARPRSAAPINRALAAKDGPIVPLIAETGGINAMIVDATALPEQVTDDVVTSAFRSAGQRCSALRLLCVQEDVADRMIEMIAGAASELVARRSARSRDPCRAGDRRRGQGASSTAGSPAMPAQAGDLPLGRGRALPPRGTYVPPTIIALDRAARSAGGGVRPGAARGALARRRARRAARRHRRQRLRADARHPHPHRRRRPSRSSRGLPTATSTSTAT